MKAVTRALDRAIAKVAKERFEELSEGLSHEQIARKVLRALRSLEALRRGKMPEYNDWDALLYSTWYQPGHINLAYTLARKIPKDMNPLETGKGGLRVVDFGCGGLAMQFGLALAAADTFRDHQVIAPVTVLSEDISESMKSIGWRVWHAFVHKTRRNKRLDALRDVCHEMRFDDQESSANVRWLTALHVAYKENAVEVKNALDNLVVNESPHIVLVTTHEGSARHAFSPDPNGYSDNSDGLFGTTFALQGEFEMTTRFRANLYDIISNGSRLLSPRDNSFVRNYLKRYPTNWVTTDNFETRDFLYIRR